MAPLARPFTATGVTLASVAAICTAAPAVVPGQLAGLPAVSSAQYRLAAANLQVPDLFVISQVGYGNVLGPDDPFFPGEFNNDVKITGPRGLAYYVVDKVLRDPYNLENYFFEVGAKSSNPITGGLAAVVYVQTAALFGVDNLITQAVKAAVTGGNVGAAVGTAISSAIGSLVYKIPVLGPIASVYITGKAPGDPTEYGTGINGVIAYAGKLIPALGFLFGPPRSAAAVQAPSAAAVSTADVAAAPADSAVAAVAEVAPPKAAASRSVRKIAAQARTEAKADAAVTGAAKAEGAKAEAPEIEAPEAEAPETVAPETEAAEVETPKLSPTSEAPETEADEATEAAPAPQPAPVAAARVTAPSAAGSAAAAVAPKRVATRIQSAAKAAKADRAAKRAAKAGRAG